MNRLILYTQDLEGLGSSRWLMSMCQSLVAFFPNLTILIVSGSALGESFRIPAGIDYIKLPNLSDQKSAESSVDPLLKLRADIILCSVANFKPDVMMVDEEPLGTKNELKSTLDYVHAYLPKTKVILILRDILDSPDATQALWARQGFSSTIQMYFHEISVLGSPTVFDPREEYAFTPAMKALTHFWGYICPEPGLKSGAQVRQELGIGSREPLVLVNVGGGEDGRHIIENYLEGYVDVPSSQRWFTLIIFGSEMAPDVRFRLEHWGKVFPRVHMLDSTDDLMSYMDAADVVVGRSGYGTVCQILTLNKPAIVIPRMRLGQAQGLRAQRMEQLGVFHVIHPDCLTPGNLMGAVYKQFAEKKCKAAVQIPTIDFKTFAENNLIVQSLREGSSVKLLAPKKPKNLMKVQSLK